MRTAWHVGTAAAFTLAAILTMRPWLDPSVVPGNDFPGFAAEVEWTKVKLDRDGTLPTWTPDRFGGTTRFMSNLKEIAAYPLATAFGTVQGTKLMFLLMRMVGAFGVYLIGARCLGAPAAGLVAGYAYGFGAPANLQSALGGHLDLAISSALFPMILLAATAMLRDGSPRAAVGLGVLVAVELCVHSYLQAMVVPAIVLPLLWLRPWRQDPLEETVPARRWLRLGAAAGGVCLVLAASQLAWLAADLRHHTLHSPETIASGLEQYVEHSPFLYVNRNDWLGGWLAAHAPPGMLTSDFDHFFDQRRYLGLVALALCIGGWFAARAEFSLRRWFQAFLLLLAFQYWMAIGPHTLVGQLARGFHWPEGVEGAVRVALSVGAVACVVWGVVLLRRRAVVPFARVELAFGLALLQLVASHSLFALLSTLLPLLRGMRSPGHFFDLASFPLFCMLGVAVTALLRRVRPAARAPLVVAVAAALVLDYLPTLAAFERRRDGAAIETLRQAVTALPGGDGSLRIASSPGSNPPASSLVTVAASAGSAWGWLSWQAGRYWEPYLTIAMTTFTPGVENPRTRDLARRTSDALLRSGRIRWVLEDFIAAPRLRVEPSWRHLAEAGTLALWEGPEVLPMGTVFGGYALFVGGSEWKPASAMAAAFARGVLGVSGGERLADSTEATVAGAGVVYAMGDEPLGDSASRDLASRHAGTVLDVRDASAARRWAAFLDARPPRAATAAAYTRPSPERMTFAADAGADPGILFVSEGYHPWWRARVDGTDAEVLRAQIGFMAVRLPPGAHRVELELRVPLALRVADRVTQLAWIVLAGAALVAAGRALRRAAA